MSKFPRSLPSIDYGTVKKRYMELRDEGLLAGVSILSQLTIDWEQLGWSAVRTGVKTGLSVSSPSFGKMGTVPKLPSKNDTYDSVALLQPAEKEFLGFIEKVVGKVITRISKSKWFNRVKNIIGIGFEFLTTAITNMIKSIPKLDGVIPFWQQAKDVVKGIDSIINTLETKSDLGKLDGARDAMGKGVPSIAMDGFINYVETEMLMWAGKSAYQFGKSLAGIFVTIFAAPAATVMNTVTAIVEAVYSFVMAIYQAFCFNSACKKCDEYLTNGGKIQEFGKEFNSIVAACPLIGATFFALKADIGGINLTCLLQDFTKVVADNSLIYAAAEKICEVHKLACKYIVGLNFKPTPRNGSDEGMKLSLERIQWTAETQQMEVESKRSLLVKGVKFANRLLN